MKLEKPPARKMSLRLALFWRRQFLAPLLWALGLTARALRLVGAAAADVELWAFRALLRLARVS